MSNERTRMLRLLTWQMPKIPDETDFFFWRYDDGSEAAVAIDCESEEEVYARVFDDKDARKDYQKQLKAQNKRKGMDFEKNKVKLKSGLDYVESATGDRKKITIAAKPHLLQMLEACGQDLEARAQMVQLFSTLLAGYFFSFLAKKNLFPIDEPVMEYAPVVTCRLRDGVNDLLRDVVFSLCIETCGDLSEGYGELVYTQPCCLPTRATDKKMLDCAYIELGCTKKKIFPSRYPAQYRETGVFVDTRFFTATDLLHFQKRNCWAAMVLYGAKDQALLTDPIRLDSAVLAQYGYQDSWSKERVRALVRFFVWWLLGRFEEKETRTDYEQKLHSYSQIIDQHNKKRGSLKIRKLKRVWLETQLLALEEFCTFATEAGCWTTEEGAELLAGWKHLLLPECGLYPKVLVPIGTPGRPVLPEQDSQELFETVLKSMLSEENWPHFICVPPKTIFEVRVGDTEIWGYIRDYQDKKAHEHIPTLQIHETVFREVAKRFSPVTCNWDEIIKHLRDAKPAYLHPSKTARMPGVTQGAERTLILKIDQMAFLPCETKSFLL